MSQYQKGKTNLDFTEARDSEWQCHQLGHMQVCTSLQTDNHASTPPLSFYRPDALLPPNQQRQSIKGKVSQLKITYKFPSYFLASCRCTVILVRINTVSLCFKVSRSVEFCFDALRLYVTLLCMYSTPAIFLNLMHDQRRATDKERTNLRWVQK